MSSFIVFTGVKLKGLSLKIGVSCLCMYVLLYVCAGIGFMD